MAFQKISIEADPMIHRYTWLSGYSAGFASMALVALLVAALWPI